MNTEKRKYKCEGCGKDRPCYVETNQEPSDISIPIEDLKCILDATNQTSYHWEEVQLETHPNGYTAADAKLDGIPTEGESSLSASACYAVCYWDQKYDDHGIDGVYKNFVKACEVSRDFTKRTGIPSQVKQTTLIA